MTVDHGSKNKSCDSGCNLNESDSPNSSETCGNFDFKLRSSGVKIVHHNVNHILNKLDQIRLLISSSNPSIDMYGVCETFLSDDVLDQELYIEGFTMVRADRPGGKGGGIIVYVRDAFEFVRRSDIDCLGIETIWIELIVPYTRNVLLGFVYRPPSSLVDWNERFEQQISKVCSEGKKSIVLGDFNVDTLKQERYDHLDNLMTSYGYKQMITVPTRIVEDTSTIIDHIYVSDESKVLEVSVPDISLSDHFPIGITWCLSSYKECTNMDNPHKLITYRDTKGLNVDSYIYDLVNANWPASGDHGNLDSQLNEFCELFQTVTDLHVPLKQKRVKQTEQPKWITREILDAIHKRDTLRRQGPSVEYR